MEIQTSFKVLDNILALNLVITLWSAKKKMTAEDLGGIELPPEDLASLGSKRIADPENIKIFGTLKSRAFNFLDRHGVRFMSGWAIPEDKAGLIVNELAAIKADFLKAKDEFLADYDQSLEAWIEKHNEWANIIRNSVVGSDYVSERLDFKWQIFKVSPMENGEQSGVDTGLPEEVIGLGGTLYNEVAKSADEMWKKVYGGKTEVTHKALSPLRTLHNKLIGLTCIEPHVAPIADIIQEALNLMPEKGNIKGTDLLMLQGLVCLLRDSGALVLHAQKLSGGYSAASVLNSLLGNGESLKEPEIEEADSTSVRGDTPDLSSLISINKTKAKIPNMGLW